MGDFLKTILRKLIPKNIAGILGVIQKAFDVIRELLAFATRVIAPLIPGDRDDKLIAWIDSKFKIIDAGFQKVKDFLLSVGV